MAKFRPSKKLKSKKKRPAKKTRKTRAKKRVIRRKKAPAKKKRKTRAKKTAKKTRVKGAKASSIKNRCGTATVKPQKDGTWLVVARPKGSAVVQAKAGSKAEAMRGARALLIRAPKSATEAKNTLRAAPLITAKGKGKKGRRPCRKKKVRVKNPRRRSRSFSWIKAMDAAQKNYRAGKSPVSRGKLVFPFIADVDGDPWVFVSAKGQTLTGYNMRWTIANDREPGYPVEAHRAYLPGPGGAPVSIATLLAGGTRGNPHGSSFAYPKNTPIDLGVWQSKLTLRTAGAEWWPDQKTLVLTWDSGHMNRYPAPTKKWAQDMLRYDLKFKKVKGPSRKKRKNPYGTQPPAEPGWYEWPQGGNPLDPSEHAQVRRYARAADMARREANMDGDFESANYYGGKQAAAYEIAKRYGPATPTHPRANPAPERRLRRAATRAKRRSTVSSWHQAADAYWSHMRPGQEIDAWGLARATGLAPHQAEDELNRLVAEGRAYRDGNWYGPTQSNPRANASAPHDVLVYVPDEGRYFTVNSFPNRREAEAEAARLQRAHHHSGPEYSPSYTVMPSRPYRERNPYYGASGAFESDFPFASSGGAPAFAPASNPMRSNPMMAIVG